MGRATPRHTWTDREVALLVTASNTMAVARAGRPGYESLQSLLDRWSKAESRHAVAAMGATADRARARRKLQAIARTILQTPIDWKRLTKSKAVA